MLLLLHPRPACPRWEPDPASPRCRLCGRWFTPLRRRHHCRCCGSLACGKCAPPVVVGDECALSHGTSMESSARGPSGDAGAVAGGAIIADMFRSMGFPVGTRVRACVGCRGEMRSTNRRNQGRPQNWLTSVVARWWWRSGDAASEDNDDVLRETKDDTRQDVAPFMLAAECAAGLDFLIRGFVDPPVMHCEVSAKLLADTSGCAHRLASRRQGQFFAHLHGPLELLGDAACSGVSVFGETAEVPVNITGREADLVANQEGDRDGPGNTDRGRFRSGNADTDNRGSLENERSGPACVLDDKLHERQQDAADTRNGSGSSLSGSGSGSGSSKTTGTGGGGRVTYRADGEHDSSAKRRYREKRNAKLRRSSEPDTGAEHRHRSLSAIPRTASAFVNTDEPEWEDVMDAWAQGPLRLRITASGGDDPSSTMLARGMGRRSRNGSDSESSDYYSDTSGSFKTANSRSSSPDHAKTADRRTLSMDESEGGLHSDIASAGRFGSLSSFSSRDVYLNYRSLQVPIANATISNTLSNRTERKALEPEFVRDWIQLLRRPLGTALKARMFSGLPRAIRPLAWPHISGADCRMRRNPGVYAHAAWLLPAFREDALVEPPSVRPRTSGDGESVVDHLLERADVIISHDLPRTFPESDYFSRPATREALTRVLRVYARYDPHLGYEQGMNCIAGIVLFALGGDEELAFWTLVQLLETYGVGQLFSTRNIAAEASLSGRHTKVTESADAPGALRDLLRQFDDLLESEVPDLHAHLVGLRVDVSIAAAQWFRTLMTHCLTVNAAMRVLDAFLADGFDVLLWLGISVMHYWSDDLMQMTTEVGVLQFLVQANHGAQGSEIERAVLDILDSQDADLGVF